MLAHQEESESAKTTKVYSREEFEDLLKELRDDGYHVAVDREVDNVIPINENIRVESREVSVLVEV